MKQFSSNTCIWQDQRKISSTLGHTHNISKQKHEIWPIICKLTVDKDEK
jgi:hypothetical protein